MLNLEAKDDPFKSLVEFVRQIVNPGQNEISKANDAIRLGFQENFSAESAGSGAKWQALAPSTVRERLRLGYGARPILVRSGSLLNSLMGGTDSVEEFSTSNDGWVLSVGTKNKYAIFHELGTSKMPARPFIEISQSSQEKVADSLEQMISEIERRVLGA